MEPPARDPLNAPGDFYVVEGSCCACEAPEREAPDLMAHESAARIGYQCHFRRQPTTPDELDRAVMAVAIGCVRMVRYGGTDPAILARLAELHSADACDHPAVPAAVTARR